MKYDDIVPRRHELLRQRAKIDQELKALDAPLIAQMAATDEYQRWVSPSGVAELDLKKMHKKRDPKTL